MARTSSGIPDQAASRSSGRDNEDAWSNRLNLFIRVTRELMLSISLGVALLGTEG